MIFKCKICGGELNIERGQSIVECEYCGVKQTLPKLFDENVKLMYDRANNYLLHSEFDKAENIFNQILFADKEDADAYWSLVLCKYGISYVKDPMTGKYVPTCNRTYYSSIFDDENYKNALKYANEEKAELFKADAKTIDDIQHGIIAISKKEKPFDIFISYKETDLNGGRTKDSIAAQDLYEKLTNEGYKVFFSRITLEDKIGTEYEPYIYAALASSRVMITVCSSKENIESVWVKNEWSRFFSFSQKDSTKTILPLYFDMDKSELPDEFAHLPSYDMKTDGFEQDLIRGIKKLIPLPIMEKERREKRKKIFKKIGIGATACLVIAAICMIPWFMKLPDYNAAMQLYYDKNYPEAAWTFADLGKYRKSQEMKDKCEKSWRKSLATVITYNYLGADSELYSINPNGIIENDYGAAHDGLGLDEHGKIISINDNEKLYALHDDGYVDNASQNTGISDEDWNDIIQISPVLDGKTNVALNSKGQMRYGNVEWASIMNEWHNIVEFKTYNDVQQGGAMVIGLSSNGKLYGAADDIMQYYTKGEFDSILSQFDNVLKFDFCVDILSDRTFAEALNIVAITKDKKIISYIDGEFSEKEIDNAIDVSLAYDIYGGYKIHYLNTDGEIINIDTNKYVFEDIVYINDQFYITRSGSVYSSYYDDGRIKNNKENLKAAVYDEWIERLN